MNKFRVGDKVIVKNVKLPTGYTITVQGYKTEVIEVLDKKHIRVRNMENGYWSGYTVESKYFDFQKKYKTPLLKVLNQ